MSAIIRIRIYQEMNMVNNMSIFLHRCVCGWHSCAFTRVWFYQLGILLVLCSSCCHVPSNLPSCSHHVHISFLTLKHILPTCPTFLHLLLEWIFPFCACVTSSAQHCLIHMRSQLFDSSVLLNVLHITSTVVRLNTTDCILVPWLS